MVSTQRGDVGNHGGARNIRDENPANDKVAPKEAHNKECNKGIILEESERDCVGLTVRWSIPMHVAPSVDVVLSIVFSQKALYERAFIAFDLMQRAKKAEAGD
ncbi:hypothetical protein RJT34_17757 [Clitoria ternatea]|uniref:Uncharacterized protein n=1 Tax=Clitoria ternatea TaxID=43366 RepID=A0AAN9PDE6_CLITE